MSIVVAAVIEGEVHMAADRRVSRDHLILTPRTKIHSSGPLCVGVAGMTRLHQIVKKLIGKMNISPRLPAMTQSESISVVEDILDRIIKANQDEGLEFPIQGEFLIGFGPHLFWAEGNRYWDRVEPGRFGAIGSGNQFALGASFEKPPSVAILTRMVRAACEHNLSCGDGFDLWGRGQFLTQRDHLPDYEVPYSTKNHSTGNHPPIQPQPAPSGAKPV